MAAIPNSLQDFDTIDHTAQLSAELNDTRDKASITNGDDGDIETDVLIVGGGLGGMYGTHHFRKLGLSVKVFEAGSGLGGTWFWNRYPGARVDSETPYYAFSIPEVYKDWTWKERFPGHEELREYFRHVDETLDLSRDAYFNKIVTSATYSQDHGRWTVKTEDGSEASCKYLVTAVGSTHKVYWPNFEGLQRYKGRLIHSARWPQERLDVKGKRVCVVGSGATGVQIVQSLAREDCELTVCVRTPNTALPMRQRQMTVEEQAQTKNFYQSILMSARDCWGGFPYNPAPAHWETLSRDQRHSLYEELWGKGGFSFFVSNFPELLRNRELNKEIYTFWSEKIRARIRDPAKRDILAPKRQLHWIFTKRPSLEQDYYEMIDRDNVTVMDLKANNIETFTDKGIIFAHDQEREFDIIIMATGYDNVTGSLFDMGLVDTDGISLADKWKKGIYTYLGMTINKMPNLFMVYSPQAPTALSNGPPCIEIQIEWIGRAIQKMRLEGINYIDAQAIAAEKWRDEVQSISNETLYPETNSWFMGANIPGKPREQLIYLGGLNTYNRVINEALDVWKGFDICKNATKH